MVTCVSLRIPMWQVRFFKGVYPAPDAADRRRSRSGCRHLAMHYLGPCINIGAPINRIGAAGIA